MIKSGMIRNAKYDSGIKTVGFVGAGTMGCFNALTAVCGGYRANIFDKSPETLASFLGRIKKLAKRKLTDQSKVEQAVEQIRLVTDLEQVAAESDLVSESVYERITVKRDVLQQLDRFCSPDTIITTNTSAIPLYNLESALKKPNRFAALHSHLYSNLYDVAEGSQTDPTVIDRLKSYVHSLGGYPVMVRRGEIGYCYNIMIGGLFSAAIVLAVDFDIDPQEIDHAWMIRADYGVGPFGMMDAVGLNVIHDSASDVADGDLFQKKMRARKEHLFQPFILADTLGMKSGKGFYGYPNPSYLAPEFLTHKVSCSEAYIGLLLGLVCQAIILVAHQRTTPINADRIWMLGQRSNIGPFGLLDKIGLNTFMDILGNKGAEKALPQGSSKHVKEFLEPYLAKNEIGLSCGKGIYRYPMPEYQTKGFARNWETVG